MTLALGIVLAAVVVLVVALPFLREPTTADDRLDAPSQDLSSRRVTSIRESLIQAGVPAEKISAGAFGEKQAHGRPKQREQAAFRQQLSRQSPLARSQCPAHGHFFLAGRRTREQKTGDVGASNHEHKTDRSQENPKCATHVSNLVVQ